ncbi:MAG: hypothetical protein ACI9GM_000587 [Salibacteraceae bacterium]|jgi:hypothetical protein
MDPLNSSHLHKTEKTVTLNIVDCAIDQIAIPTSIAIF